MMIDRVSCCCLRSTRFPFFMLSQLPITIYHGVTVAHASHDENILRHYLDYKFKEIHFWFRTPHEAMAQEPPKDGPIPVKDGSTFEQAAKEYIDMLVAAG